MKKRKYASVVAGLSLATAFTLFACSSDSGDTPSPEISSSSLDVEISSSSLEENPISSSEDGSSSSSSTTVSLCAGEEYDSDVFRCEAGELIGRCKGVDYYYAYQFCNNGVIEEKYPDISYPVILSSSSAQSSSSMTLSSSSIELSSSGIVPSSSSSLDLGVSSSSEERSSSSVVSSSSVMPSSSSVISSSSIIPSSSSLQPVEVLCVIGGICISITDDICAMAIGTQVESCPVASSSSVAPSSSSVVPISSSSSSIADGYVLYGDEIYPTVVIGTQTWFAKNLNIDVEGSKCYNNLPSNCDIYGRLYNWAAAMALPNDCNSDNCSSQVNTKHRGICPSGWHLPTQDEWFTLKDYVGDPAGTKLKTKSGWSSNGNGIDSYGFAAFPGSRSNSDGTFNVNGIISNAGFWWTTSEFSNANNAYYMSMTYTSSDVIRSAHYKTMMSSVRCLKD